MSAEPFLSAAMTPAASGAGITVDFTLSERASSATRSGTGPVATPVFAFMRPWTGLLPRNTARSAPVGARIDAGDWLSRLTPSTPTATSAVRYRTSISFPSWHRFLPSGFLDDTHAGTCTDARRARRDHGLQALEISN